MQLSHLQVYFWQLCCLLINQNVNSIHQVQKKGKFPIHTCVTERFESLFYPTHVADPTENCINHCTLPLLVITLNCCGPRELLVSFRVWQYCCLIAKCVIIPFENHSSSHQRVRKLLFVYSTYKSRKSNNMCSRPINLVLLSELQSLLFGWKPIRNAREHFVGIPVAFPDLVTLLLFSPKSCNKLLK